MSNNKSLITIIALWTLLVFSSLFLYPKYSKSGTEATISWDVSGYYHYLPAIFIYNDLKELKYQDDIISTYQPTPDPQQSFQLANGNFAMKYSCGQAIQMTPFFLLGHVFANAIPGYKSDGYSRPYQLSISVGALLFALLGLIFWRRWLLLHFDDSVTAIVILLIGIGTNYFEYAGITGAMTHNNLFMLYSLLLLLSHRYHKSPTYFIALFIGLCIGLMSLTRPTEIISCFIPILYGASLFSFDSIKSKFKFHFNHKFKLAIAVLATICVGSIQLIYWKYISGDWLVYSYEEQGFSWLRPHIWQGLFSYNNGWLPYSPTMLFSLLGIPLIILYKEGQYSFLIVNILLFIYVAFAWDIWWYGGSLGQRTVVQLYPILSFPLALFIKSIFHSKKFLKIVIALIAIIFIYINLWFSYQAHGGGMLHVEQMTKAYYWKTIGTWTKNTEHLALLDNKDFYDGQLETINARNINLTFSSYKNQECTTQHTFTLNKSCPHTPIINSAEINKISQWLRLSAMITIEQKEWNVWHMPQMILKYVDTRGNVIKTNMVRLHRTMSPNSTITVSLYSKVPSSEFSQIEIHFWNAHGSVITHIDDIQLVSF